MRHNVSHSGMVYIVGAGPGDPGLVTLRGAECLARADVVFYDYLVNTAILRHARPGAELVCLGHHSTGRALPQEQLQAEMIRAARAGRCVVRLKGGDPDVFGRSAEELAALREAGIAFETVPGITAALAAAAYAEIPLTHAEHCSAVALVTGHQRDAKSAPPLDYSRLARFPGPLVFYMGVRSAATWSAALVRGGKPPDTPVAVVRRCSFSDQATYRCTLATVAATIAAHRVAPPAVIVVGEVAGLVPATSWFTARPLAGTTVLVTRPRHQAGGLYDRFRELGAEVLVQPAIETVAPADWSAVDDALERLEHFHWVVFSSANGVRFLLDRLVATGRDARSLGAARLAAIGPGTARELAQYHLQPDLVPGQFRAEALAEALHDEAPGRRFLLVRASRGREVLAERLRAAGAGVEQVVAYESRDVERPEAAVAGALASGRIGWVTVTSSAIARRLAALFGDDLKRTRLASISPITSAVLGELGHPPAAEAEEYTMEGVVRAILAAESSSQRPSATAD